jgi:hypothetical protein
VSDDNRNNGHHETAWAIHSQFTIDSNDPATFKDGDAVCLISINDGPRFTLLSFKIGAWWKGRFVPSFRPDYSKDASAAALVVADLYVWAAEQCKLIDEAKQRERAESKARREQEEAMRRRGNPLNKVPVPVGKTARDKAKPSSGRKTNDPTLSRSMKGGGGGGKNK